MGVLSWPSMGFESLNLIWSFVAGPDEPQLFSSHLIDSAVSHTCLAKQVRLGWGVTPACPLVAKLRYQRID